MIGHKLYTSTGETCDQRRLEQVRTHPDGRLAINAVSIESEQIRTRDTRSTPSRSNPNEPGPESESFEPESERINRTRIRINRIRTEQPYPNPNPKNHVHLRDARPTSSQSKRTRAMNAVSEEQRRQRVQSQTNDNLVGSIIAPCQRLDCHEHLWLKKSDDVYITDNNKRSKHTTVNQRFSD